MHIYISSVGGDLGSLPEAFNKLSLVDKAYVIIDHDRQNDGGKRARKFFEDCCVPYQIIVVDGKKDFRGIIEAIRKIAEENKQYKDLRYSMNITGGTTLMSSALCYSAFFIGAETYYVLFDKEKKKQGIPQDPLEERIVKLPTTSVPDIKNLGASTRKVLDQIYAFYDSPEVRGKDILTHSRLEELVGMSSSKVGYHLGLLRNKGIISTMEKKSNRNITEILISEDGMMIKGWLDII